MTYRTKSARKAVMKTTISICMSGMTRRCSKEPGHPPFFSVDNPREGTPNQVPWNVEDWRPIDFFFRMIPAKFFDLLVDQSNLYASQKMSGVRGHSNRFGPEITRNEVFSFIAILFAMGVCRCRNLQMYWDDKSPSVISLPSVSHVLDRTRFDTIKKFFHMADNSKAAPKGSPSHDILHKVRPLLSELQSNCRKYWKVGTFASLDESMINFRGRSRFKQYIKSKPHKWGFKFFSVCDSITGYFIHFELYTGKQTVEEKYGLCTDVVLKLVKECGLEGSKTVVVADNYYTSPQLCALLATKGIGFIGTCQLSRKHVPAPLIQFSERRTNIAPGSAKTASVVLNSVHSSLPAVPLYCISWCDTRIVNFLGTAGGVETTHVIRRNRDGSEKNVQAPLLVKTYTERMGGVDLADQNKQRYSVAAAVVTRKWWFRIFQGLLDIAITNAWQIYKFFGMKGYRYNHQRFIFSVCDSLLQEGARSALPPSVTRSEYGEGHIVVKQDGKSRCVICNTNPKKKRTVYMCLKCRCALCAEKCFDYFHTHNVNVSCHFKNCTPRIGGQ